MKSGAHIPRWRQGRSVQLIYKMLCQPLSNKLHKMPIYGQTLSKQGGGTKWLTIQKNLPTNRTQCTCSTWVRKKKGSYSEPTSHEENHINIACFTTSRGNEEYGSIWNKWQPQKKKLQAKTTTDRLHKNFWGSLVAHEMNSIHFSHSAYKILHLLLQQPSSTCTCI